MVVLSIIFGVLTILLVAVQAVVIERSKLSLFELTRRVSTGDVAAKRMQRREAYRGDVISLQKAVAALLLVVISALSITIFGWIIGTIVAVFVALESGAVARWSLFTKPVSRLYAQHEKALLRFVEKAPWLFRLIRTITPSDHGGLRPESREELLHMIDESRTIITADERTTIKATLEFDSRQVGEIMTPRGVIDSVESSELLGPLALDELHKTGHSRFPVIQGDIDHVVGMLYLQDLITLKDKKSLTASKAMNPHVYYVREDQTLQRALAAFLKTRHHLMIVINRYRETVGVVSLEDVIEALLGRKIVDEFDKHDDLRAVAERNLPGNNQPPKHTDI